MNTMFKLHISAWMSLLDLCKQPIVFSFLGGGCRSTCGMEFSRLIKDWAHFTSAMLMCWTGIKGFLWKRENLLLSEEEKVGTPISPVTTKDLWRSNRLSTMAFPHDGQAQHVTPQLFRWEKPQTLGSVARKPQSNPSKNWWSTQAGWPTETHKLYMLLMQGWCVSQDVLPKPMDTIWAKNTDEQDKYWFFASVQKNKKQLLTLMKWL